LRSPGRQDCPTGDGYPAQRDLRGSFFDSISWEWLVRFLEHRIGDQRIIRLIQKWLKAGVLEGS
jgi:hypothetical protein